jgi:23S rRNA pseudouridine2605 synthase
MKDSAPASERIQKVLAESGVGSRRAVEALIGEGRITVNGEPATLGQKIGATDRVKFDGRPVRLSTKPAAGRVLLYKKRVGELVTREDPEGRKTVFRKLPALDGGRWIAVGRLDINTSGLLLLTNDGELARRLTHPSFELEREYAVRVLGEMTEEILGRLRNGVRLEDGIAHFDKIVPGDNEDGEGANQWWRVTLREGRNREVRRMFESQNLQVSRLIRVRYGPVELGRGVKSSGWRELEPDELKALYAAVGQERTKGVRKRPTAVPNRPVRGDRPHKPRRPGRN